MGFFPKSAKSRGHDLIEAIWGARDHAPISEIEELIPLARKKPSIK